MVLPSSGQIAISDLRSEFGDTPGEDALSEYYRGAGYVPDNNNNVPTSGQIALSNFHSGANGYYVSVGQWNPFAGFVVRGWDNGATGLGGGGSQTPSHWRSQSPQYYIGWSRVSAFTFKGATTYTFSIGIQGSHGRYLFSRYYDGSFNLYASSAGLTNASGYTVWSWNTGYWGQYGGGAVRYFLYN
jgi:hypothetical protein